MTRKKLRAGRLAAGKLWKVVAPPEGTMLREAGCHGAVSVGKEPPRRAGAAKAG